MYYTSTRDKSIRISSAEAITKGISAEGGLFVPTEIPHITLDDIKRIGTLPYTGRAKEILKLYLTDFTEDELNYCVEGAYKKSSFSSEKIAPLYKISDKESILELWRGPTCAFKDMALQLSRILRLLFLSQPRVTQEKQHLRALKMWIILKYLSFTLLTV